MTLCRNYIICLKEIFVSWIGYIISNNTIKLVKNTVKSKESPHFLEINLPETISAVPSAAADFRLPGTALRSRTHGLISKVSSPIKACIRSGNLWPWRHVTNGKGWLSILSFCWGENWGLVEHRWVYIFGPIFGSFCNVLWNRRYFKEEGTIICILPLQKVKIEITCNLDFLNNVRKIQHHHQVNYFNIWPLTCTQNMCIEYFWIWSWQSPHALFLSLSLIIIRVSWVITFRWLRVFVKNCESNAVQG